MIAVVIGFLIYMILDRLSLLHSNHYGKNTKIITGIGAGSLSVHSFLDGIAIGLAFKIAASIGIVIAMAVVAHEFSDGINTVSVLLKNKGNRSDAIRWLIIDALAPVIGVFSTFLFVISAPLFGLALSLFAGFFLYIEAGDLLPQSISGYPKIWTSLMTILGALVSFLVAKISGT